MEGSLQNRAITAEEFYALPEDDLKHELVEGLVTSEPLDDARHGRVSVVVGTALGRFVRENALGMIVSRSGFVLARNPDTVRGPDVAFVGMGRVRQVSDLRGYFPGAPDLAVEVISLSDPLADVHSKVADFLAAGTRLVWVVDPETERVTVYRNLLAPRVLTKVDELDGEDLLPGFRVGVGDLFEI